MRIALPHRPWSSTRIKNKLLRRKSSAAKTKVPASRRSAEKPLHPLLPSHNSLLPSHNSLLPSHNSLPPAYHECVNSPPPPLEYSHERFSCCKNEEKNPENTPATPPQSGALSPPPHAAMIVAATNGATAVEEKSARGASPLARCAQVDAPLQQASAPPEPRALSKGQTVTLAPVGPHLAVNPPLSHPHMTVYAQMSVHPAAGIRFRSQLSQATATRFPAAVSGAKRQRPRAAVDYAELACVGSQCDSWNYYFVRLQWIALCLVVVAFLAAVAKQEK